MSDARERIRTLNDELRQHLLVGGAVMTPGIAALGPEAVRRLIQTIALFDDFCTENDPYGEHDFGSFPFEGRNVVFKIDYYDKELNHRAADPADPSVTARIITIMFADEY
jgi:hypothetical protein